MGLFIHRLILRLSIVLYLTLTSMAYGYDFSPQSSSQVAKDAQRWSLAQWMEQKSNFKWMDMWLIANTKSPSYYEVYIGADHSMMERSIFVTSNTANTLEGISSKSGHIGMFISLFGLYGRYESSADSERTSWDALAMLRILGTTDQGSNLTLFYGLKDYNLSLDKSQHQQAGGYLTLYLLKAWALQGRYSHFFEATTSSGSQLSGHRMEASTWIEWGPVRLYGSYFKEPLEHSLGNTASETVFEGYSIGIRTYLDFKK